MTDLTLRLLRDGYRAIERDRAARGGATTYESRMLGRRAVVLGGASGAQVFYDDAVVRRKAAIPPPLAWLLFGRGAVHGLDDTDHLARKEMFLGVLGPEQVADCARAAGAELARASAVWRGRDVDLHDELVVAYGTAVLRWVGVDLATLRLRDLSREYARIVNGFGFAGPAYVRAWVARRRTDRWARELVADVRQGRSTAPDGSVLSVIAASDLDDRLAGVELGNVVRPTIAVSWLGVHAARALAEVDDDTRRRLAGDDADAEALRWSFAQEVRRTTPFVPALTGLVRRRSSHAGVALPPRHHVVLDVCGINLDPERYPDPLAFRADRFLHDAPGRYDLVPQGGGEPTGHRCPGESLTLQLLVRTTEVLAGLRMDVPTGGPDLGRIPTLPDAQTVSVRH